MLTTYRKMRFNATASMLPANSTNQGRTPLHSRFAVDNLQLRTETLVEQPADLSEILPCVVRLREIDLIVIGGHGRAGFKRLVLRGS